MSLELFNDIHVETPWPSTLANKKRQMNFRSQPRLSMLPQITSLCRCGNSWGVMKGWLGEKYPAWNWPFAPENGWPVFRGKLSAFGSKMIHSQIPITAVKKLPSCKLTTATCEPKTSEDTSQTPTKTILNSLPNLFGGCSPKKWPPKNLLQPSIHILKFWCWATIRQITTMNQNVTLRHLK